MDRAFLSGMAKSGEYPFVSNGFSIHRAGARKNTVLASVSFFCLILLTRLPFIFNGYGHDPDATRMAMAARQIAESGHYVASRAPGFPLPEYAFTLLRPGGAPLTNAATAALSAVAALLFALSLRRLGAGSPWLAGLALAMVPVVYINSVSSMDYLWALVFMLASFHAVLAARPTGAGILLGLAIASRLTSVLFLLPALLLFAWILPREKRFRASLLFCVTSLLLASAWYVAPWLSLSKDFLSIAWESYPSPLTLARHGLLEVWGPLGLVALAFAALFFMRKTGRTPLLFHNRDAGLYRALSLGVAVYLLLFFILPHEAGYLLPMVPFLLALLALVLPTRRFRWVAATLVLSPLLFSISLEPLDSPRATDAFILPQGEHVISFNLHGAIFEDARTREEERAYISQVLIAARFLPEGDRIIAGFWMPKLLQQADSRTAVRFVYALDDNGLKRLSASGNHVWYLLDVDQFVRAINGCEIRRYGAVGLRIAPAALRQ